MPGRPVFLFLRNLSPDARKLILGRRYNRQKKQEHDGGKGKERSGGQNEPHLKTAERIAAEHHVSPATVKRAGKFAEAADQKPEVATAILPTSVDRASAIADLGLGGVGHYSTLSALFLMCENGD